jgi:hypothetical protein
MLASLSLVALCLSCGGSETTYTCVTSAGKTTTTTSRSQCNYPPARSTTTYTYIENRAFITNYITGVIDIVDTDTDELSTNVIALASGPTFMKSTPDQLTTLVYNSGSASGAAVYNPAEKLGSTSTFSGTTDTMIPGPSNQTYYIALRDYVNSSGPTGAVQLVNFAIPEVTATISVAQARWLALSHDGTRLLVMADNSDDIYVINPLSSVPYAIKLSVPSGTFSRPVDAFFSADDTKAWVLSCGPECGGTTAGLQEVTLATATVDKSISLAAGRAAVRSGDTLYVTGAPSGSTANGVVQSVDMDAMTAGTAVAIGPGTHTYIKYLGGQVLVGGVNCGANSGCLSIWNPANATATVTASALGNVTGFDYVTSRKVYYVAEGGNLNIYDLNGKAVTPLSSGMLPNSKFQALDIVGRAWDVLMVPNDNDVSD